MSMLVAQKFEEKRMKRALDMLLIDRRNEFRELAASLFFGVPSSRHIEKGEMFVLNFCFEVSEAFKCWSGTKNLEVTSAMKALTILRQCSRGKKTLNQMTHLLNIAYNLAEEFRVIYKRIE